MDCPFCSHGAGRILYQVTSAEAATHFISPWRNRARNNELQSIIERLWGKSTCQLIECDGCSGVFASPFVGGDSDFYRVSFEEQKKGSYPTDRWEYGKSLLQCDHLGTASLTNSTCLEVGSGDGAFVRRLIDAKVPQSAITALEYSSYGIAAMRSRYPGVDVHHGDDLPTLPDGVFTHVFLFQVLEHLGDLNSFMSRIRRLLKPGGFAFVSVPNPVRIEFNELNGLLLDMPPNHISRFTDGAVKSLSSRNGFTLELQVDEDFSWQSRVAQFLQYRYLRLAQRSGTAPARIDANLNGASRKLAAGIFTLTLLPEAVLKLRANRTTGASRLIVLQKCGA